jgi:2-polyprenyl-3-methyl-5-hydroxy-6-metoxy-1,4-benzoquinol methylase
MIRPNNPEIDVDELMARVRTEAALIRAAGPLDEAGAGLDERTARRVARAVERYHVVWSLLDSAVRKNMPRREWPQRLRFLTRFGPLARAGLRAWNYLFKEQREKDAVILQALRELAAMQLPVGEYALEVGGALERGLDQSLRRDALLRADFDALGSAERPAPPAVGAAFSANAAGRSSRDDALYLAIEDRFRGSRALIAERLAAYVPLLAGNGTVTPATPVLDLGAGRGEFVAVLGAAGLAARGVDANAVAVAEGRMRDLPVETGDLFDVLRAAPDAAFGAVTAIHVIEHLPFEGVVGLIRESLRVLVPGGMLLLETPNPANLVVAAKTFYYDPTHRAPVPAELTQLVVEALGFTEVRILELHPADAARVNDPSPLGTRFDELFAGPQDYAIVARSPSA